MNWITKALIFGEKIKKVLKKRPSKEDIENSDWTNCCKGPILKKELEENLSVCKLCDKHHRITCLLYTSPSPRDLSSSRMPSSA